MIVGNDDLGAIYISQHVRGYNFPMAVIAFRIIRKQDAKAIPDGDSRGDNEEPAGELPAVGMTNRIHGLPGN